MELWQRILLQEEAVRMRGTGPATAAQKQPAAAPQQVVVQEKSSVRYRTLYEYDSSGNVEYIGQSETSTSKESATWRIRKLFYDTSGNMTEIRWAEGNQKFDKIWNRREGYTYT